MAISKIETDSLASGLVAPTATALTTASGSAPSYSARAWVNFNGTGTVAIRAAGNVSSITDNGTGDYTVNFTTAMPDVNYTAVCSTSGNGGNNSVVVLPFTSGTSQITPTTTQLRLATVQAVTAIIDSPYIQVSVFR
jgi:hypothetical protein